jgi:DNA invertase Pin-like site-specific DNA recombinase
MMKLNLIDLQIIRKEMDGRPIKEVATMTEIHRSTLYRLIEKGHARPSTIRQLKTFLKIMDLETATFATSATDTMRSRGF